MKQKRVLLNKREISAVLKKHADWSVNPKETQLYRTFTFSKYIDGLVFIARVSVHAEVLQHHPDIEFSYGKVKIKLTTHDLKGLTMVDVALLERIDKLYTQQCSRERYSDSSRV